MSPFLRGLLTVALVSLMSACLPGVGRVPPIVPEQPGLEVSVGEHFYGIAGVSAREVNLELSQRGPFHEGARWQGLTDFRLVYRYRTLPLADGCRAADARVSVDVVTTLPRWKDRDDASEPLRGDWDLFMSRLREHERGHQEIAILTGRELLERVASMEAPDCAALSEDVRALADAIRSSVDVEQRIWDLGTAHGIRTGG